MDETPMTTQHRSHLRTIASVARALAIVVAAALAVGLAQAPRAGAHDDGTTAHLWLDHVKPIGVPGTINDSTNPIDWTKLKDVPADIADGTDDGVEHAGSGLNHYGSILYVNSDSAQRRVSASCPSGRGIKSITKLGAVTCTTGPRGFSKVIDNVGPFCNSECTVGTLVLNPGTWLINSKLEVYQSDFDVDQLLFDCHLDAGGKSARGGYLLYHTWGDVTQRIQLVASFEPADPTDFHASLVCGDADVGEARGLHLSIIAMRVS